MRNGGGSDEKRHPTQVVVRRAGLTADVLRVWEKRYAAVEPVRTAGGHRLYSDNDVERLRLLKRATDSGRRIGQVAKLDTDELAAVLREDERQEAEALKLHIVGTAEHTESKSFVEAALDAVYVLDARRVKSILEWAAVESMYRWPAFS